MFGRDEGGSEFTFTHEHIDTALTRWSQIVRAEGYYAVLKPSAGSIMALDLCVSDKNKPLILANAGFIPYLVDALLLDPGHPRADMALELKTWCQEHHAECLAQLAMFEPAREALCQDPSVIPALEAVAEAGLSAEARKFADATLQVLSGKQPGMVVEEGGQIQMHVMLSCKCTRQWPHDVVACDF